MRAKPCLPEVAAFTRVCAYDRPGTTLGTDQFSRSDPCRAAHRSGRRRRPACAAWSRGNPSALRARGTFDRRADREALRQHLSEGGRWSRARGRDPEGVQAAMTPEQWKVYDRLLLIDPPKELAGYKELETIDFDVSFDQMRAASKRRRSPLSRSS